MLAVGSSYYGLYYTDINFSIHSLLSVFKKVCWISSNAFSSSIDHVTLSFVLLMLCLCGGRKFWGFLFCHLALTELNFMHSIPFSPWLSRELTLPPAPGGGPDPTKDHLISLASDEIYWVPWWWDFTGVNVIQGKDCCPVGRFWESLPSSSGRASKNNVLCQSPCMWTRKYVQLLLAGILWPWENWP